jgi:hypothetical protein
MFKSIIQRFDHDGTESTSAIININNNAFDQWLVWIGLSMLKNAT